MSAVPRCRATLELTYKLFISSSHLHCIKPFMSRVISSQWKNLLPKLNNKICQKDMPIPLQWTIWYQFLKITHPGMLTTLCLWNNYKTMWHLTPQGSSRKITSIHDKESGPSMILSDNNDSHVSLLLLQSKNILVKDDGSCCIADLGLSVVQKYDGISFMDRPRNQQVCLHLTYHTKWLLSGLILCIQ